MATEPSILTTGLFAQIESVRRTIYRLVIVLVATLLVAYPFAKYVLSFVKQPLGASLVMYAPLKEFLGYIKVSIATGVLLASPLVLYEINRFLKVACRDQYRSARRVV